MNINQITGRTRRNVLLAATGLVVAFVRNYLQHHQYSFESAWEFLGFWFVHYLAVELLGTIFYGLSSWADRAIIGITKTDPGLSVEEGLVYFSLAILVCSVAVFFIAHWPAGLAETLEE